MAHDTIFVQIASYRDPELVPTVLDCIARAKHPERLKFGICWQFAEGESISQIAHLPQVRFVGVPHQESKGACWARAIASELYDGQDFYLQIDSHHRFVDGWDEQSIEMLKGLEADGIKKPLLTAYPPAFDPSNDPAGRAHGGIQLDFNTFSDTAIFTVSSSQIKDWEKRTKPIRGRFFAAGYAFARASFLHEVPYDPSYYFHGEEMNMAFRAFTHGYDIFHPHKPVLWHQYIRQDAPKHWKDHVKTPEKEATRKQTWDQLNSESLRRLKHFFSFDGFRYEDIEWGRYGRGTVRTLRDYELFTGIDFRLKKITEACLKKQEPVATWNRSIAGADWEKLLLNSYEHTIELMSGVLSLDDYDFILLAYDRADGSNIYTSNIKDDALKSLLERLKTPNAMTPLVTKFFSDQMPHKWVFWPHSKSKGWIGRIGGMMPKMLA